MSLGRRRFMAAIAGALLASPLAASAQQTDRVRRIGVLRIGSPPDPYVEVFREASRELAYVETRSFVLDVRYARGDPDQLVALAAEFVRPPVDVLVTSGIRAMLAAKHATTVIIFAAGGGDPVADGFVVSLSQPGGNMTGLTVGPPELEGKRLRRVS